MGALDRATRLEPEGERSWSVHLDEAWRIGPKMHGGYLLAVLAHAGVAAVAPEAPDHTVPQAVTGTFLRAPEAGPARLDAEVLRRGRGASQVRVRLEQPGAGPCLEAALTLAAPARPDPAHSDSTGPSPAPVTLAPREQCPRSPADGGDGRGELPIMDVVDVRLDPDCLGFLRGEPSGRGRMDGWVSLADDEPWTPAALLVALDVLPPAVFDLGLTGWSPTMSLTAHVHAQAAPGPLRVSQWVDHASTDRMHESCRAWDSAGRLVGQATQLAAIRR